MALTKYKIGELIDIVDERNSSGITDFYGININKEFMPTVANTDGIDGSNYKVVRRNRFVFSGMQTGRDNCIRISMYSSDKPIIVSPAYTTFEITAEDKVMPTYFFLFFCSKEKDRLGAFYSDGSIRSNLDWDRFCDIEINLPPIEIQKKYVDIYDAMIANQACYEHGLEDLKMTCDAYIENLRREIGVEQIAQHIHEKSNKVSDSNKQYRSKDIAGISSVEKRFMETKADTGGVSLGSYKIVEPNDFSFNPNTARMGDRIPIALNDTDKDILVSAIYPVFSVDESLEPEYLMMWFKRSEFDRYARFNSWGSARETFDFPDMKEVEIPIPSKDIQRAIVDIYKSYTTRKDICDHLKTQIRSICPILIKGSLEEANR